MWTPKHAQQLREELESCKNPLFFYDDDPDGVCGFLLLYRFLREGRGIIVKTTPKLDAKFLQKVEEYAPDKIFALDIPIVEQEFIDGAKVPVVWVDHHPPLQRAKVKYFNPRINDEHAYVPTTTMCYSAVKQDIWIGMVGSIADWHIPDFAGEFAELFPALFDPAITSPEVARFDTKVGEMAKIFSFLLKGQTGDVKQCIKVLTRIETPHELLEEQTPAGKYLMRRFRKINEKYQELLQDALAQQKDDDFFLYTYSEDKWSFTSDLATELLHQNKNKVVIVARERSGEFKCSLRGRIPVSALLQKALVGIEGYGGGHEVACGASIKAEDFGRFVESFVDEMGENIR